MTKNTYFILANAKMLDLIKPKRFFHPFPQAHFKQKWHSGLRKKFNQKINKRFLY